MLHLRKSLAAFLGGGAIILSAIAVLLSSVAAWVGPDNYPALFFIAMMASLVIGLPSIVFVLLLEPVVSGSLVGYLMGVAYPVNGAFWGWIAWKIWQGRHSSTSDS